MGLHNDEGKTVPQKVSGIIKTTYYIFGVIEYGSNIMAAIAAILLGFGAAVSLYLSGFLTNILEIYKRPDIINSITLIIGWVVAVFFWFRYENRKYQLKKAKKFLKKMEANNKNFSRLAHLNRDCDKALFDIFVQEVAPPLPADWAVTTSLERIGENIDNLLDYACRIFEQLTGGECSACIKIVDEPLHAITPLFDLEVHTLRRDPHSREARSRHDRSRVDQIRDNTADMTIFTPNGTEYRTDVWASDRLKELAAQGKYKNARDGWSNDYKATVVCGISNLKEETRLPWRGLFCVDSQIGGLDNDIAKYYAREFSSRLSVMIYRSDVLEEMNSRHLLKRKMLGGEE